MKNIELEKIIGNKKQIKILFQLLKNREYNISNVCMPNFKEHIKFVKNHPYRVWCLIKFHSFYVGSIYIMKNNCIGVSIIKKISIFSQVINIIFQKYKPLKEIKSLRPKHFYVNISLRNKKIESQLIGIGATKIQSTYSLSSIKINV